MDIGTAKPDAAELRLIPHHLINIINPDEDFGLAQYQQLAYRAIGDIQARNKLAFLVGGSGQYIWSLLEGWGIPPVPPDPELRSNLETRAAREGAEEIYRELAKVDPVAAQRIDRRNVRRVIRALEVFHSTGIPFSELRQKSKPPFESLIIGLTAGRAELYEKIDGRVDAMMEQGLVAEVENLIRMGYDCNLPAMSGIGYRQIGRFLSDELDLSTAVQQIKFETHRFVRQQYNWFRPDDARIRWFNVSDGDADRTVTDLITRSIGTSADEFYQTSGRRE
jgi:tRNA dimethylallyltransferase